MAQNLRKIIVGEGYFLSGVGITLIGSSPIFIDPLIYYLVAICGFVIALYGVYLIVFQGILTGSEYRAFQAIGWLISFIFVGLGFYCAPFVLGLPMTLSVYGWTPLFRPASAFLNAGLLQCGIAILGIGLVIPDAIRQARMTTSERFRIPGQVESYKTLVAPFQPEKNSDENTEEADI